MDTINARIGLDLDAEDGSLQRWGTVIGKTYEDFKSSFPAFHPDPLISLVMATDGRSEGSNFPNLVVAGERLRYGL